MSWVQATGMMPDNKLSLRMIVEREIRLPQAGGRGPERHLSFRLIEVTSPVEEQLIPAQLDQGGPGGEGSTHAHPSHESKGLGLLQLAALVVVFLKVRRAAD